MEKAKLENIDLQSKSRIENHNREIEKLLELKSRKADEINQQEIRIQELDKMWTENSDFDCPDLCKKCPYINSINKQQFEQYSKQKEKLVKDLEILKLKFKEQDFDKKINDLKNEKYSEGDEFKSDLQKKLKKQMNFSDKLRDFLIKI